MAHGDITHIEIPAEDIPRAKAFYGSVFGWDIQELPGYEDYPMWRAPNGVSGGGLTPRTENLTAPRSYVEVDSIDDALATIVELGGRVVEPKAPISDTSWYAVFEDLDGNALALYEGTTSTDG